MGNPKTKQFRLSKVFVSWGYPSPLTCNYFFGDGNSSRFALGSISLATARALCSDSLAYCYTDN